MEQNIIKVENPKLSYGDYLIEAYQKYLGNLGIINIFALLEEISNPEAQQWIYKSKHELNRFANYIILLNKREIGFIDKYNCQTIHEGLNRCSISIVFSLFNIFGLTTKTPASFFDHSIKDFFINKISLNPLELYLLSFDWHEPVLSMDSINYSNDQYFQFHLTNGKLSFQIVRKLEQSLIRNEGNELHEPIYSVEFYAIHFLKLLSTIDLLSGLLYNLISLTVSESPKGNISRFLNIENINDLLLIYNDGPPKD